MCGVLGETYSPFLSFYPFYPEVMRWELPPDSDFRPFLFGQRRFVILTVVPRVLYGNPQSRVSEEKRGVFSERKLFFELPEPSHILPPFR